MKEKNINFGKRLSELRKSKGLTQHQLGDKIGVSKRVIAYYERETNNLPANLIIPLSKALGISVKVLLNIKKEDKILNNKFAAMWRRLKVLETFSEKDKKAVFNFINIIVDKNRSK